jgi:hypothetical protein
MSGAAGAGPAPVVAPSCGTAPASDRSQLGPSLFSLPHSAPGVTCALGASVAYTAKTDQFGLLSGVTGRFVSNQSLPLKSRVGLKLIAFAGSLSKYG